MKRINLKKILNNPQIKIILMAIILLIIVIPLWQFNKTKTPVQKTKKNYTTFAHTELGIIQEETYEGLKFTNISLITEKGYTTFTATVENTNEAENPIENVYIDLKDKDDQIVTSLKCNIGKGLKSGEKRTISSKAKGQFKKVVSKAIRK